LIEIDVLKGQATQTLCLEQSVAPIGGIMAVGTPERGIDEIVRQSKCGPTRHTMAITYC
jgi:hypothetical protein